MENKELTWKNWSKGVILYFITGIPIVIFMYFVLWFCLEIIGF